MKIIFIILIILISSTITYITFPLSSDNYNLTSVDTPKQLINKLLDSKLYIIINIGSQKINVKAYLVLIGVELIISGKDIKNHKYNESNSDSYNCTYCNNRTFSSALFDGIFSVEDFNIINENNEINTVHNIKFILGKKSRNSVSPEGIVGLHLPYYDSDPDYNLIVSLKKAKATNSYNWYLDFSNFKSNESKMVIDGFPHDMNNKRYRQENFIKTNVIDDNGGYNIIWGLKFSQIYYSNQYINISLEYEPISKIQFNYKLISAPNETIKILEKNFFGEYFEKNICFIDNLGDYKET